MVWVSVDVDLADIDTDDLQKEIKKRDEFEESDIQKDITEMFYAFKLGNEKRAIELAKRIAEEQTGMII